MPPPPMKGRIVRLRTIMPMPPSQCVSARQSRMPRGFSSMLERMDAPVVVKPDMASKNASVKFAVVP